MRYVSKNVSGGRVKDGATMSLQNIGGVTKGFKRNRRGRDTEIVTLKEQYVTELNTNKMCHQ